MLNLLTPETTVSAAKEIVDGVRISTDWPLDSMPNPCFGRPALEHTIKHKAPRTVNDDVLTFNTQSSSQWDGFRHYGYQKEQLYFNGKTQQDLMESVVNGTQGISTCMFPVSYMAITTPVFMIELTRRPSQLGLPRAESSVGASSSITPAGPKRKTSP